MYEIKTRDDVLVATHQKRVLDDTGKKRYFWLKANGEMGLNGTAPGDMPLYRSEYLNTYSGNVIVTEGETAATVLASQGYHSLGTVNGASSTPSADVLNSLRGFTVILWPDNDKVGQDHMSRIADSLHGIGIPSRIVTGVETLPIGGDAADADPELVREFIDGALTHYTEGDEQPDVWSRARIEEMYIEEIERAYVAKNTGRRANLLWGKFSRLDSITDGMLPGLICIHADPGVGKSAFALQVATEVDAPVLYVTAEMSVRELTRRVVAQVGNKSRRQLFSAQMGDTETEVAVFRKVMDSLPHLEFLDASTVKCTPDFIDRQLKYLRENDPDGHALLIIDSLHAWLGPLTEDMGDISEYAAINEAMKSMRKLAQRHNIPVMFIAERNRLGQIKGSRSPEYRSDIVLTLDDERDDEGNKTQTDPALPRILVLEVLKNRNGPPGDKVTMLFSGDTQTFWEQS